MTDKPEQIIIGKGRLYFDDGLRKPRELGMVRELGMGYTTSAPIARGAFRDAYQQIVMIWLIGYNPNLLLTDQRSELAKFASGAILGETYMPDDEINLMRKREPTFSFYPYQEQAVKAIMTDPPYHRGGIVTKEVADRIFERQREHVIPTNRLHRYGMGTKKLAEAYSGVGYSAQIAAVGVERFNASMKRVQEQMRAYQERVVLMAIYAGYETEPMFRREHRIAKLLLSADPRQQKRGNRLFHQWRKTRPGINFTRYRKD